MKSFLLFTFFFFLLTRLSFCRRFFLRSSKEPFSTQYQKTKHLKDHYATNALYPPPPLPHDVFRDVKMELWEVLSLTCLPSFQLSDEYMIYKMKADVGGGEEENQQRGEGGFSKMKVEWFFGDMEKKKKAK